MLYSKVQVDGNSVVPEVLKFYVTYSDDNLSKRKTNLFDKNKIFKFVIFFYLYSDAYAMI